MTETLRDLGHIDRSSAQRVGPDVPISASPFWVRMSPLRSCSLPHEFFGPHANEPDLRSARVPPRVEERQEELRGAGV